MPSSKNFYILLCSVGSIKFIIYEVEEWFMISSNKNNNNNSIHPSIFQSSCLMQDCGNNNNNTSTNSICLLWNKRYSRISIVSQISSEYKTNDSLKISCHSFCHVTFGTKASVILCYYFLIVSEAHSAYNNA